MQKVNRVGVGNREVFLLVALDQKAEYFEAVGRGRAVFCTPESFNLFERGLVFFLVANRFEFHVYSSKRSCDQFFKPRAASPVAERVQS